MLPFLHDVLLRDVRVAIDARDAQEVSTAPSRPLTRTLILTLALTLTLTRSRAQASSGMRDAAPIFVVASSENLIRAIVGEWEGLSEEELAEVDVPYATPLVYQLDTDLVPP